MSRESYPTTGGFSLVETVASLAILLTIGGASVSVFRELSTSRILQGAARTVRVELQRARSTAVARREVVSIRLLDGALVIHDAQDRELRRTPLTDGPSGVVDSVELRPQTLRFNARGQAGPGSVYLHKGSRSVRIVINFVGRIRLERIRR